MREDCGTREIDLEKKGCKFPANLPSTQRKGSGHARRRIPWEDKKVKDLNCTLE